MAYKYKKNKPYFRSLSHTIRNKKKVPALSIEGQIWLDNGFKIDDVILIEPKGKGKLLIKTYSER